MTPVNKEHYDNHLGRILDPDEYEQVAHYAEYMGRQFGITDEIVIQVLSDAKAKRAPYEKAAAAIRAAELTPEVIKEYYTRLGWKSQDGEIRPPDDLSPFGLIIERALYNALGNMHVHGLMLRREIRDRDGEGKMAFIDYGVSEFIKKILRVTLA